MQWLLDGLVGYILSVYNGFFTGIADIYQLVQVAPDEWVDGKLWTAVVQFNETAVLPVAYSIVALFLLLEMASILQKSQLKGMDQLEWILRVFVKIVIAKLVMDNMSLIINAIFDVTASIVSNGGSIVLNEQINNLSNTFDATAMSDALEGISIVDAFGMFIMTFLLSGAQAVCLLLCKLLIQLRFIEIYAFTAISALPFATLPSEEYSQIGKSFIKRMVALALHVIFISIALFMFVTLLANTTFVVDSSNPLGALTTAFGFTLLLCIVLFQTSGWSKALVGVQ